MKNSKFMKIDRDTLYVMPPSVDDWLPEEHVARFVVDIVAQLDLSSIEQSYGSIVGRKAYPVQVLVGLLIYGYVTGVFSSRKLELATYESVPFRYVAANMHPDHDTIASFRKTYGKEFENIFLQVLTIASEMGIVKLGNVSTDGTKIEANASKHKALSWEYAKKLEQQLKDEIAKLKKLAQDAESEIPEGMNIPEELVRREKRLETIEAAKKEIEERAKQRYEREKAEYDAKMTARKEHEELTGKKSGGKKPQPPIETPEATDQVNLIDKESRIMPKSGGKEFVQGYNAQATATVDSMLIVASHVTQNTNDKREIEPALAELHKTEKAIQQKCTGISTDAGYFSSENVQLCENSNKVPYMAERREPHNKTLEARFSATSEQPPNDSADALTKMRHRMKTKDGKAVYAKRKSTIEPVFGIVKNVMKFKRFMLRGLNAVTNEWKLVALSFNIKRMFSLKGKIGAVKHA
jgi:transposase